MWLYILPVDALEVVRTSALKVAKAAQAVAKFFLQVRALANVCMHVLVCFSCMPAALDGCCHDSCDCP
jgi:hypothetical protein